MLASAQLEEVLQAVGDLLKAQGEDVGIVVVGGASLNLMGFVLRTTNDVDIIATVQPGATGGDIQLHPPPEPLPDPLQRAIDTVARDFGLPADWMNTEIAAQWTQGLPPWLADDLTWRRYGGLEVGLAGRRTLIALKLFAAVDRGPRSVHYQDLVALEPALDELRDVAAWVSTQDAAAEFSEMVDQVIDHVQRDTRDDDQGDR